MIKCEKTGKHLPGSLTENFMMEFHYPGKAPARYRSTLDITPLMDLEQRLAKTFQEFLDEEPSSEDGE